ncbi:MAG: AAA family ATPase [Caldisericia bacterium]|nr:AAA family ATPase [Caldisericia bacterium]
MLLRVNIENFKSICNNKKFSMIAYTKLKKHTNHLITLKDNLKVLKASAIFGANASGKSNLIEAMYFAKHLITKGFPNKNMYRSFFCKTKKQNEERATRFDFEFSIQDKVYAYGFTILLKSGQFQTEYLYLLDKESQLPLFERDTTLGICNINENYFQQQDMKRLEVYKEDFAKDTSVLFLREINRRKSFPQNSSLQIFIAIFGWFNSSLSIINPYTELYQTPYILFTNKEKIEKALQDFDTGIAEIKLMEVTKEKLIEELSFHLPNTLDSSEIVNDILLDIREKSKGEPVVVRFQNIGLYQIIYGENKEPTISSFCFRHENSEYTFTLLEESDGTKRLFDLLFILFLDTPEKVFVIDEIERSLHPNLVKKYLTLFFERNKDLKTQLIFTSHESLLLDQTIFRRDEIWFVEKNNHGETHLYSLKDFDERYDKRLSNAYLKGRYGAIPSFKDLQESESENGSTS